MTIKQLETSIFHAYTVHPGQNTSNCLKCYLLAGCASFGVFGAHEVLRMASVR